jgi:GT2 family glycosyltransferase
MKKVAVVILNWNGLHYLEKFLQKVITYSKFDESETWVVDNGSTDGSVQYIREHHPNVRLLVFGINYGFACGYRMALEQIAADYYVLLNSDVEVTQGWLETLYQAMEANPMLGACMPKLLSYDQPDCFEYAGAAGGYIDSFGYPFCRGRILNHVETDIGQYDSYSEIFWASGACMFVRSSAYREAGGLDGDFFAHMEEIDLCWRMKRLGYAVAFIADTCVFHVGGGTLPNNNPRKIFLNYRNNLYLLFKNLKRNRLLPIILIRMLLDGASALVYLFSGQGAFFMAVLRAHLQFYVNIPSLVHKRLHFKYIPRPLKLKGIYPGSIVFDFFIRKKHTFRELEQPNRHHWL